VPVGLARKQRRDRRQATVGGPLPRSLLYGGSGSQFHQGSTVALAPSRPFSAQQIPLFRLRATIRGISRSGRSFCGGQARESLYTRTFRSGFGRCQTMSNSHDRSEC
jgi:hypothetical protein